jgi:hypothetical protein
MKTNANNQNMISTPGGRIVNFTPNQAVAVTPSDTTILQEGLLYIGTGGSLRVRPSGQTTTVLFTGIPDGTFLPVLVDMVYSTDLATCAGILICY